MYHSDGTDEKRIASDRIKERRLELGYSLRSLANLMGVEHTCIYKWETGKRPNISYRTLKELSRVLQCDPSYLCGYSDQTRDADYGNDRSDIILIDLLKKLTPEEKSKLVQHCIKTFPDRFGDAENGVQNGSKSE